MSDINYSDLHQKTTPSVPWDFVIITDSEDWNLVKIQDAILFQWPKWDTWLSINWKWAYSWVTAYVVNDAVSYNWNSYICKLASIGNLPTNTTYFDLMAENGGGGWSLNYVAVNSNQSISPSNFYWVTCTTSDVTLTLTNWTNVWDILSIKKLDNSWYSLIVNWNIELDLAITMWIQYESIDLYWNWTYYLIK